jgi:hypothetical protein
MNPIAYYLLEYFPVLLIYIAPRRQVKIPPFLNFLWIISPSIAQEAIHSGKKAIE